LLALLGARHFLHVSRIRVKLHGMYNIKSENLILFFHYL